VYAIKCLNDVNKMHNTNISLIHIPTCTMYMLYTYPHALCICVYVCMSVFYYVYVYMYTYGVATISRIDKITGLFCRISSLL